MSEHNLTFREFPSLLADLISTRDILAEKSYEASKSGNLEEIQQTGQDLRECETALRVCVTELVKKADGVAAFIRSEESGAAVAKAEANRCYELAKAREARADRVKAIALEVLQQIGVKFVKGEVSELRRWGNGGAHPVEVRQPELLPAKYQRFEVRMSGEELEQLVYVHTGVHEWLKLRAKPIEPDTELIRKDLMVEGPCSNCNGLGRWNTDDGHGPAFECVRCNGTGKAYVGSVPGAALVDRGEHLRVK